MKKSRLIWFDIALSAIAASLLIVVQVALSFIPNIELISLLIIIYSIHLKAKALYAIYIFALVEGLIYGFGVWWIMYLYVWTVLYFIARFFSFITSCVGWAVISGLFGLLFGALCSIPYFFILGFGGGIAYFISGIPFDFLHCAGNFVTALALFTPINFAMGKLMSLYRAYL